MEARGCDPHDNGETCLSVGDFIGEEIVQLLGIVGDFLLLARAGFDFTFCFTILPPD